MHGNSPARGNMDDPPETQGSAGDIGSAATRPAMILVFAIDIVKLQLS